MRSLTLAFLAAAALLPAAAVQVLRSRLAAARVMALLDSVDTGRADRPAVPRDAEASVPAVSGTAAHGPDASVGGGGALTGADGLVARDLACGWPGRPAVVTGLDLAVRPGRSVAVVGPSGTTPEFTSVVPS